MPTFLYEQQVIALCFIGECTHESLCIKLSLLLGNLYQLTKKTYRKEIVPTLRSMAQVLGIFAIQYKKSLLRFCSGLFSYLSWTIKFAFNVKFLPMFNFAQYLFACSYQLVMKFCIQYRNSSCVQILPITCLLITVIEPMHGLNT